MGRISVWEDDKGLEMDNGDRCTTMSMYLMPLKCTLKMIKMVSFVMCIFYHNKSSNSNSNNNNK